MTHHLGPLIGSQDSLRVIDCRACGYAHLETLPTPSELITFYETEFWTREKKGWLERYQAQLDWQSAIYGDWLSLVEGVTLGRTLLDVGCGYGFFLQAAQLRGWGIAGIDPSPEALAYAKTILTKGWALCLGTWAGAFSNTMQFDCLSALWLIEHLPDPRAFLVWCRLRLYSGGALLLSCPHDFSAKQLEIHGSVARPYYWLHKTHLNYFNGATLSNLLGLAGFQIVERLTMFDMANFLPNMDYTAGGKLGDKLHIDVRAFDLSMTREQRIKHYQDLARLGKGRELIVIARPI